jgi:hypothetical protein
MQSKAYTKHPMYKLVVANMWYFSVLNPSFSSDELTRG